MAGVVRIAFGVLFLIAGVFFLLSIFGFILGLVLLLIGIVLLASGMSASNDAERMRAQQEQTNRLLAQQLQMSAAIAARPAPAPYAPTAPPSAPMFADRYCPACGQGNARSAGFCQRCGRPLPPPP